MNAVKATILAMAVLLGIAASAVASAHGGNHRGGVRFGVFVGAPAFWYYPPPYYYRPYYYPPYYYPQAVMVPAAPTVYVEQGQPPPTPARSAPGPAQSYWYYCRESNAYYPYVNECSGPWEPVAPRPPS